MRPGSALFLDIYQVNSRFVWVVVLTVAFVIALVVMRRQDSKKTNELLLAGTYTALLAAVLSFTQTPPKVRSGSDAPVPGPSRPVDPPRSAPGVPAPVSPGGGRTWLLCEGVDSMPAAAASAGRMPNLLVRVTESGTLTEVERAVLSSRLTGLLRQPSLIPDGSVQLAATLQEKPRERVPTVLIVLNWTHESASGRWEASEAILARGADLETARSNGMTCAARAAASRIALTTAGV